jgi:sugar phosphate isomerase/epimerase
MRLGIDSFSVRWQGWNAIEIIDYAHGLGLENVHFSERAHLGGLDPAELARIRDHAHDRDMTLEVGMRSFNQFSGTFDSSLGTGEQQLRDMIVAATIVGSPVVRCFVGMADDRLGGIPRLLDETVRVLQAVAPDAEAAGVTIAVENHGGVDLLAPELRDIIEAVGSSHVGVCLDTGNPVYAAEDAVQATEILAPYTVSTHLRDTKAWLVDDGAMVQWAPVGRGSVDLPRILQILAEQAPDAPIDLEIITGVGPKHLSFAEDSDLWRLYPDMRASAFARFQAFARKGEPGPFEQQQLPDGMWQPPDDQLDMYRAQQRAHFEESVAWMRAHAPVRSVAPGDA